MVFEFLRAEATYAKDYRRRSSETHSLSLLKMLNKNTHMDGMKKMFVAIICFLSVHVV